MSSVRPSQRWPGLLSICCAATALGTVMSALSASAEVRALPVPAVTIYPDDVITASKLADRKFQVTATSVQGFATEKAGIVGKQARRRLAAGKPIPLASLEDHVAVRRGMSLIARYAGDGFSISSRLIALEDGIEGNIISARNGATGVIVQALVRGDGTLLVTGE